MAAQKGPSVERTSTVQAVSAETATRELGVRAPRTRKRAAARASARAAQAKKLMGCG